MKKSKALLLNIFMLIIMVISPLASFAPVPTHAQMIGSEKNDTLIDITAKKNWQGGPEEKPELWFQLMQANGKELEPVPGLLPLEITTEKKPCNLV